ncbi:FGGY-family carbohydrate kinase [[Eubacterium] cellulosolvens]
MASGFLLGIDIGTLGSKGVLIDLEGKVIAEHFVEHSINVVKPGWVEQDPEACYWQDFKNIAQTILRSSMVNPKDIAGIGVSSLAPDIAPIDCAGKPIRPCIIYMDRRAQKECDWVRDNIGFDKVFEISGNAIDSYYAGYEVIWYLNNEPEKYKETWKILNADKYVVYRLTGEAVIDHSTATVFAPLFDYQQKRWSEEICQIVDVDIDKLPKSYEACQVVGEISPEAKRQTGLAKGTPVISGAPDAMTAALSVGTLKEGETCLTYGTTLCWIITQDIPRFDPRFVNTLSVSGGYDSCGAMATTGAIIRWFRDQFGQPEREIAERKRESAYKILDKQAERIPPGSDGLVTLPYFMGERTPIWDAKAKGLIFGLNLYHTRAHIYRSFLEAAGYGLRQHMDITRQAGIPIKTMIAANGGAKSKLWRQIISDITGYPQLYIPQARGAPFGDAFLAGVGAGVFSRFDDIKKYVKVEEKVIPDKIASDIYTKLYTVYEDLYTHTKVDGDRIHTITSNQ